MNVGGLLASVGVNSVVCLGVFSLYSVLRKQPSFVSVYFGQKLARSQSKRHDPFWLGRLVPSASWVVKAWDATEDELYTSGGIDAVVFLRAVVLNIKICVVASVMCLGVILPLNYFGKEMQHKHIREELLTVFTIGNVRRGSEWLGFHCLVLHIITLCACFFLYYEFKYIMKMRLNHINSPLYRPSQFTVVVRAIPWIDQESYSDTLARFFTDFYASSYLSHQMVYEKSAIQKLMSDAERMYKILRSIHMERRYVKRLLRCGFCGNDPSQSFKALSDESQSITKEETFLDDSDECGAALVFFRTRYAALVASEALQSQNPMAWVTDAAPEPRDMFWANLCVSYQSLWIRKIIVVVASIFFVTFFLVPVVFTQSLVHLDKLTRLLPFLEKVVRRVVLEQLVTGYLPSVVITLFLYMVPPVMYVFSTLEGAISRSERKRSACIKVLYFVVWNVFFANILTEAAIDHYQISILKLGDTKNIPTLLAKAVPSTATFFMTYCLTSGWASLACELIQPLPVLTNAISKYVLQSTDNSYTPFSFPYHTEVPRVLLFGLLGITCSTLAPLILPFVLVYFVLAFLVYRNQILNVYVSEYDSGGQYWPIVHNTTIFSLVLMQVIALGVFGIKDAPGPSTFTFPLIILTLLFNQFCRQRFLPVFFRTPAKSVIEMDRRDEQSGQMEEIHQSLLSAYTQYNNSKNEKKQKNVEMSRTDSELDGTERGAISHA